MHELYALVCILEVPGVRVLDLVFGEFADGAAEGFGFTRVTSSSMAVGTPYALFSSSLLCWNRRSMVSAWFSKLMSMTEAGCPSAHDRFTRRPASARSPCGRRSVDVFDVVVFGHGILLMLSTDSMSGLVLVNPQANSVEKCRSPVSDSKMASILP